MTFESLGLAEPLLRAVGDRGYAEPTPIQLQAIPVVLEGADLLAGAQTGTGKTAGFVLPILHRLAGSKPAPRANGRAPIRALILTPTRELAAQVEESVRAYGKYLPLKSMTMFGGVNINPQISALRGRIDILVATPGRLLDHVQQRTVDLSGVEILVLDEADRMLDMGFIRDIKKILALLPPRRQNLLFSATFSDEIRSLADGLLDSPRSIEVARRNAPAEAVAQRVLVVDRGRKRELLSSLIKRHNWFQVLVFTRTKHGANRLAEQLNKDGITALAIHGNKSQGARTRALAEFKSGDLQVLVATDIAARGLDIVDLPHVVNYELPNVSEDYVHRIGRTGRAGASGEAVSLVCIDEYKFLADIEKLIKRRFEREIVPGFELDPNDRPEPIVLGRRTMLGGSGASHGQRGSHGGRTSPGNGGVPGHRNGDGGRTSFGNRGGDGNRGSHGKPPGSGGQPARSGGPQHGQPARPALGGGMPAKRSGGNGTPARRGAGGNSAPTRGNSSPRPRTAGRGR